MRHVVLFAIAFAFFSGLPFGSQAQDDNHPFILPIQGDPGPNRWLFGQAYGNTTGAFNFGTEWYSAGQGLHFGLDFPAPCGTPLVAVADGEVAGVDDLTRGAGPHNLLLVHRELGVTTLYGHLLRRADLFPGQLVRQGDVIGLSGDPDRTCDSRPHLHFEVRSLDYRTAYNPVDYIDANWHTLASVGGYGYPLFQQDMDNARRWMTLEDQPATAFGGARLNAYDAAWPLPFDLRPPDNAPLPRPYRPLPDNLDWQLRRVGFDQCCWSHWWDPVDPDRFYVIDGSPGQRAAVSAWDATTGTVAGIVNAAPPAVTSPDGRYEIYNNGGYARIVDRTNDSEFTTPLLGATPAINPGGTRLTWTTRSAGVLPGQARPIASVWVADLDGYNARQIASEPDLSGRWLDADRLLLSQRSSGPQTTLSVYDLRDNSRFTLGTFDNIRGLTVAPGGAHLMFYLLFQPEPAASGVYLLATTPDPQPVHMPWFGAWRWRDSGSVYYLPFDPSSPHHTLAHYDITTGEDRILVVPETQPFTIMNGDWDVSADGRRIIFQNALDRNMWLLEWAEPD
ncbi:MAG: M23 family metallopeptidase [Chloroflexota bacterium]